MATPILTGSLIRLPLGILTDRFGGRVVFFIQMILVAIPTYGLAFATQYWQYLAIGLFVGLAGGSFAIGIAYTSAWFPKEKQGTAMGIFGAGNAGSAVTNLAAPLIIVAFGWRAVPQVYSIAMLVMAVLFWFFTYPDPKLEERRQKGTFPSLIDQLAPLAEMRVWRFCLAYFFVFGGFVALALWLPKYYVSEYGLSLQSAAFITMFFTLPSGLIRALGGWISDKFGGSTTTWWVFWVCIVCLFFLSYPPTTLVVHGVKGDVNFHIAVGVVFFTVLIFVVGIAQGIGKASVYRELADYYPANMGSVGGLVGVIGGLGGFILPIVFGIAVDATNVRSSAFMLMYVVVAGTMVWTWVAEKGERAAVLEREPALRDQMVKEHLVGVRAARRWLTDWRPDDAAFWQQQGRRIALRNLILSMPPLFLSFAVWMVWSVVVVELPKIGFQFTTSQLFWLAAAPGISGGALRLAYAFVVPIFGGRNWTVFSTASLLLPTLWMALAIQNPTTNYAVFVAIALLCGLGGGNFSASMANISFFFPKRMQGTALGWNAGFGNLGVGVMQAVVPLTIYGGALAIHGRLTADLYRRRRRHQSLDAERRLYLGAVHPGWRPSRPPGARTTSATHRRACANKSGSSSASMPGSWRGSTPAHSARSSDLPPRSRNCCRPISRHPKPSIGPSSARCWARWSARSAAGCPTASAAARSPSGTSPSCWWPRSRSWHSCRRLRPAHRRPGSSRASCCCSSRPASATVRCSMSSPMSS